MAKRATPGKKEATKKRDSKGESQRPVKGKKKQLTVDRLRHIIPHVANKNRRRDLAGRLRGLVRQERTKKRRAGQAAEARGEKVEKGVPHTIESLRRPDETIGTQTLNFLGFKV